MFGSACACLRPVEFQRNIPANLELLIRNDDSLTFIFKNYKIYLKDNFVNCVKYSSEDLISVFCDVPNILLNKSLLSDNIN